MTLTPAYAPFCADCRSRYIEGDRDGFNYGCNDADACFEIAEARQDAARSAHCDAIAAVRNAYAESAPRATTDALRANEAAALDALKAAEAHTHALNHPDISTYRVIHADLYREQEARDRDEAREMERDADERRPV